MSEEKADGSSKDTSKDSEIDKAFPPAFQDFVKTLSNDKTKQEAFKAGRGIVEADASVAVKYLETKRTQIKGETAKQITGTICGALVLVVCVLAGVFVLHTNPEDEVLRDVGKDLIHWGKWGLVVLAGGTLSPKLAKAIVEAIKG